MRDAAQRIAREGVNLHLVGHVHTGTNWMKHLVSTMLYLASNFDTHPFFAAMASDRVATWNVTFHSMFYDGRFKHDIPHWPELRMGILGPAACATWTARR